MDLVHDFKWFSQPISCLKFFFLSLSLSFVLCLCLSSSFFFWTNFFVHYIIECVGVSYLKMLTRITWIFRKACHSHFATESFFEKSLSSQSYKYSTLNNINPYKAITFWLKQKVKVDQSVSVEFRFVSFRISLILVDSILSFSFSFSFCVNEHLYGDDLKLL